tara:strand:- start:74 stop:385 length:312 start_codon:yes stop_codon:yes gene_type:complete
MNEIILAINALKPNSKFSFSKNSEGIQTLDIEHLVWLDDTQTQPTEDEINTEVLHQESQQYKIARATAYPSIGDQLDAIWKGGEAEADMLATVQAVKAKYPKA